MQVEKSGSIQWCVKMLTELTKTKIAIAREDYSEGKISEEDLKLMLMQNKLIMRYIAY